MGRFAPLSLHRQAFILLMMVLCNSQNSPKVKILLVFIVCPVPLQCEWNGNVEWHEVWRLGCEL